MNLDSCTHTELSIIKMLSQIFQTLAFLQCTMYPKKVHLGGDFSPSSEARILHLDFYNKAELLIFSIYHAHNLERRGGGRAG